MAAPKAAPKAARGGLNLLAIAGGGIAVWCAWAAPFARATGPALGTERVDRRPFDVPRLYDSEHDRWGRPVRYEELAERVGFSRESRYARSDDLAHLVALDPARGFALARETLTSRIAPGGTSAYAGWNSQVAGLDDAWARGHRRLVLDRTLAGWDPVGREQVLAREATEDLTTIPVEGRFTSDIWLQRFWNEHREAAERGAEPISWELGVPRSSFAPKPWPLGDLVAGWRTADEVVRAFADAPSDARRAELAEVASLRYGELTSGAREGLVRAHAATPAPFAGSVIGRLLDDRTSPEGARAPLTVDLGHGLGLATYLGAWEIASPARREELRRLALAELTGKGQTSALAELLRQVPGDAELRRTLRRAYWERRDIPALVADGDSTALEFARRWGADGNPAHEVDVAGLSGLPQADAITAPLLRSRASDARAAMLPGLARRHDAEALRRLRVLTNDPARRVSYAAKRIVGDPRIVACE